MVSSHTYTFPLLVPVVFETDVKYLIAIPLKNSGNRREDCASFISCASCSVKSLARKSSPNTPS